MAAACLPFGVCRDLEIEEYTDGASYTVVGGFLMLFQVEVESPVRPDPLPPSSADGSNGKIEEYIDRGQNYASADDRSESCGSADDLIAFAAPLVAKGNEVFLVVTLAGGYVLGAGEDVSGRGVSPHQAALKHDRIVEIVGAFDWARQSWAIVLL